MTDQMDNKIYFLKLGDIIFIYNTIEEFMETSPPCKECLVRASCIKEIISLEHPPDMLKIYTCGSLNNFIGDNDLFIVHYSRLDDFDKEAQK